MSRGFDKKHVGAYSELTACAWLLQEGYDVFRNVSAWGIADLIAVKWETKEVIYVDVKTVGTYSRKDGKLCLSGGRLSEEQVSSDIKMLGVFPDGSCILQRENEDIVKQTT